MSRPGSDGGYALLDALVAVLLCAIVAAAVLPGIGAAARSAGKSLERAAALVEARNREALRRMGPAEP